MQLTFISGWAGLPEFYPAFTSRGRFLTPFFQDSSDQVATTITQGGDLLIGWSLGAHMVLKQIDVALQHFPRILLVAPFLDFSSCVHPRILRRMQQRLLKEPQATIEDFWQLCGIERICPDLGQERVDSLVQGLSYLAASRINPGKVAGEAVSLVHCTQDRVVPAEAFRETAQALGQVEIIEEKYQHLLPEHELLRIVENVTGTPFL